ncbi:hypothetical protein GCM10023169_11180 [Georgenia halophila]|uniref:Integral membrane protein n=1 Tax=Georgenia halophila TaxID=620889 RepID=A0ABP8L070_9MICO
MSPTFSDVPAPLRLALAGACLEALCLAAFAVGAVASAVLGGPGGLGVAVPFAVLLIVFALLLVGSSRAQWRGMRWGRGPVITWQLLQIVTVLTVLGTVPPWGVAAALAVSVGIVVGTLWPSSRDYASTTRSTSAVL